MDRKKFIGDLAAVALKLSSLHAQCQHADLDREVKDALALSLRGLAKFCTASTRPEYNLPPELVHEAARKIGELATTLSRLIMPEKPGGGTAN